MESPATYIPMDRRQAMARGEDLPDRTRGAALFADISGFTPLTEALLKEYGPSRGAEELTRQLNLIYDALVSEVHHSGGSVLAFSGDAITCWFDGDDGLQATVCGLAMQQQMDRFSAIRTLSGRIMPLAMKVAIAAGPVRRFRLGDPRIQYIDALAGATLDRMAAAEHQAGKGEVVLGPEVIAQIGDKVNIVEWRDDLETGQRYGVVAGVLSQDSVIARPWPPLPPHALEEEQVRPWLLPPVYGRLQAGQGEFLAELRPVAVLFLTFQGIDYDEDEEAGLKLDRYIKWVQGILARYEGYLLQLTIGDKGSYLCIAFGAPMAHEDDIVRAVSAALELQARPSTLDFIDQVQIGISHGQVRAGAYGGSMRRTYGVMGDEVNLAARLMQTAASGQVLVSYPVWQAAATGFTWDTPLIVSVKGKTEPIITYSLVGLKAKQTVRLQEPRYALPMVGRETELALVEQKMQEALSGRGQIVAILADAGMGKSRLVAEVVRLATDRGLIGYGGECQAYGANISYLVWQPIWRAFFQLDSTDEAILQINQLERQLEQIDPHLVPRLPLLEAVLHLHIPDNELTASFDAKLRKTSLESLLSDCLRVRAQQAPLFLVLEDCHWLDPLSHDLLEVVARAIVDLPVLLVLASRPMQLDRLQAPRVNQLPYFTEIQLTDFTPQEAEKLISLKLDHFFGAQAQTPPELVERITNRAGGNPFYIEELLNYLRDQGFDPHHIEMLQQLELPTSLHSLVLSRIDQLTESQKSILKVASVIGRYFRAAWLWGMYPELGERQQIKTELDILNRLDLAPLDTLEPELCYLFKHMITREVTYNSLPYATRARLHEQLGLFLEQAYSSRLDEFVELLASHFEQSENNDKKREYLKKAGEAAQANYANETAIYYYQRLLPLLSDREQISTMLKLGEVLQLVGRWDEVRDLLRRALALAEQENDLLAQAWCQTSMGELRRQRRSFTEAWDWLEQARANFETLDDQAGVGQVLHYEGTLAWNQGNYEAAQALYERSLAIRRQLDDKPRIASLLSNLGLVAHTQGNYEAARQLYEESLELRYQLNNKWAIANSLNNLGYLNIEQGDYESARTQLEVALVLQREVGYKWGIANALNNLGNVARSEQKYEEARALYEEGLIINRELRDREAIAYLLEDIGGLAALQRQDERALRLVGTADSLRETIGAPLPPAEKATLERLLEPVRQELGEAAVSLKLAEGREMSLEAAIDYALQAA